jgi:hypothetical protein
MDNGLPDRYHEGIDREQDVTQDHSPHLLTSHRNMHEKRPKTRTTQRHGVHRQPQR